jgi:two-component system, LytTR family, sensor kinase
MNKLRILKHLFFWVFILVILVIVEVRFNEVTFSFAIGNELIRIVFYAILVYVNSYLLIPQMLNERRLIWYGIAVLALVGLLTPIMIASFTWRFQAYPALQDQVLDHKAGYYLLNFLITATFPLVKIISDWIKTLQDNRRIQMESIKSELRFLKSQINPHFLFNTLNSLYALTIKKSDLAPEIVLRLSDMMRYMLYECNEKWVSLQREVAYMEGYLELEKLRHGDKVSVQFTSKGPTDELKIAPLLFIPFLENSFKHGVARSLEANEIKVDLSVVGSNLEFSIENKKPMELPRPDSRKFGGIGLTNVKKRLDLLYPNMYSLVIENQPEFFRVNLKLQLQFD